MNTTSSKIDYFPDLTKANRRRELKGYGWVYYVFDHEDRSVIYGVWKNQYLKTREEPEEVTMEVLAARVKDHNGVIQRHCSREGADRFIASNEMSPTGSAADSIIESLIKTLHRLDGPAIHIRRESGRDEKSYYIQGVKIRDELIKDGTIQFPVQEEDVPAILLQVSLMRNND